VVVIDSDLPSIENLGLHLKSQGYEVTLISNATRSLSLVFQIKPNLIICAIDLPSLNGYQLCSIFRNYPSFQNTRIVLLAKEENFLSQVKAKLVGASDYWSKPLEKWEQLDSF
jgi:twitching motility two-component system response regulator PilG